MQDFANTGTVPTTDLSSASLLPAKLRGAIPSEEFDYQTLLHGLKGYSSPRDKITDLLTKGIILRIKKGLYVFGELYRRAPIQREVIANLLYGPSYISLEYALQFYGLIPEGVETLTSVTTGRQRRFRTPLGSFTYRMIPMRAFQSGMDLIQHEGMRPFLMATPEKALADKLVAERGGEFRSLRGMREYLLENLRIPRGEIRRLSLHRLDQCAASYRSRRLTLLSRAAEEIQRTAGGA